MTIPGPGSPRKGGWAGDGPSDDESPAQRHHSINWHSKVINQLNHDDEGNYLEAGQLWPVVGAAAAALAGALSLFTITVANCKEKHSTP